MVECMGEKSHGKAGSQRDPGANLAVFITLSLSQELT
jgi:hypothetical protein